MSDVDSVTEAFVVALAAYLGAEPFGMAEQRDRFRETRAKALRVLSADQYEEALCRGLRLATGSDGITSA